jgi:hypothetical protein
MKKISVITPCKGRLSYLKQTIINRVHPHIENIVVDYDCPNGTAK